MLDLSSIFFRTIFLYLFLRYLVLIKMGNATSSKRPHEEHIDSQHGIDTTNPSFVFPDHFPPDEVVNPKISGTAKHVPAVVRWKGKFFFN